LTFVKTVTSTPPMVAGWEHAPSSVQPRGMAFTVDVHVRAPVGTIVSSPAQAAVVALQYAMPGGVIPGSSTSSVPLDHSLQVQRVTSKYGRLSVHVV
jgi:hypothetical protein